MTSYQPEKYKLDILTGVDVLTLDNVRQITMKQPEQISNSFGIHRPAAVSTEMEVVAYMKEDVYMQFSKWMRTPEPHAINIYRNNGLLALAKSSYITSISAEFQYDHSDLLVTFETRSTTIGSPSEGDLRAQRIRQGIEKYKDATT
jgi:hypothetical protein